jgi:hypothetical protein
VGKLFSHAANIAMKLTTKPVFRHDPTRQTPRETPLSRFSEPSGPFFPRTPLFPALRSGHRLFQRPSPQKQIPCRHKISQYATDAIWKFQVSEDLDAWTDYEDGDPEVAVFTGPDELELTLPASATGRKFARFVVTIP